MAHKSNKRGPIPIYADAVKIQHRIMMMLNSDIARKYRFTVVAELLRMSIRLMEEVDLMNMMHGQQRQQATLKVAALVRTIANTFGNMVALHAVTRAQEADMALLVESVESQARAMWWECQRIQNGNHNGNKEMSQGASPPRKDGQNPAGRTGLAE